MQKKAFVIFFSIVFLARTATAQFGVFQQGEVGLTIGAANYFGDLNTTADLTHPKIAIGAYISHQYNPYVDVRVGVHYAQLGYSDTYSNNFFQQRRNLSFNTTIIELAVQGDFNFFKFEPGEMDHAFTPFVTFGAGIFTYNPYTYLNGQKVFLRPLGTEGQNDDFVGPDGKTRKPYGTTAFCFPIGFGVKYSINTQLNLIFQVTQRLTTTDYIDDVSTTYVGPTLPGGAPSFPNGPGGTLSEAYLLQDRSYETGTRIGNAGVQRGWSSQKDQYLIAEIGISFNLRSYSCPSTSY
jgi:Domain of unknown function (DUF6089)